MVDVSVDELKLYMELDKKINARAYELSKIFDLSGGEFDSVYVGDDGYTPEDKKNMIIIETGEFIGGEYCPTNHYLTPEEFCLSDGKQLYKSRIQKEYEELKNASKNIFRKVYKVNFEE